MRGRYVLAILLPLSAVALSACGTSPGERAITGAGLGAAGGAAAGALMGNPAMGAAAGGLVGGAVGGLTSPNDVYLGKPAWR